MIKPKKRWKIVLAVIAVLTLSGVLVMTWSMEWLSTLGGVADGAERQRIEASPNWDAETELFQNPVPTTMMTGDEGLSTMKLWLNKPDDSVPDHTLPTVTPDFTPPEGGLKLTWLGHSSYVMQVDGTTVLTDPVFSDRASPSSLVGPRRFHPVPCDLEDLPKIDAILISHDHYDHLDYRTIRELAEATDAPFLVPLGVGAHLRKWGVAEERILLHDWWDETKIGDVRLVSTPSRHFSGRKGWDQFSTLWTSWSIVGPEHRVFFSGDTGFFEGMGEIAEKLGPFDVAMYEIGAFHEKWGSIHLGPANAVKAGQLMQAKVVVPIHWGTFDLGLHSWWEPPNQFARIADEAGVNWAIADIGGSIVPGVEAHSDWWRRDGF